MNRDLYFLPILANALRGLDARQSLENAFAWIEQLGRDAGYQEGYRNFCVFMEELYARRRLLREHDVRMAMLVRAAGATGQTQDWEALVQTEIDRSPWLKEEYDALCQAVSPRARVPTLQMLREGRQIGEVSFEKVPGRRTIDGIPPGHYILRLDTGLVLWEGTFTAHDLIWVQAFGGEGLQLAAEAGEIQRRSAREVKIPEAGLVLRVFPGIESGSLEIELTP